MISKFSDDVLIVIFNFLTAKEIFNVEEATLKEYKLTDYFWEKRSPIPKSEDCWLSYYDIVKRFIKNKVCFNCNQFLPLKYIYLINQGFRDDGYYLEGYHKTCIKPIKKLSKSIGMYISPISGEQLMGLESSGI